MADEAKPLDRLECSACGCRHFEVTNTIGARRRRVCRNCGRPLQTREIPEAIYQQLVAEDKAKTTTVARSIAGPPVEQVGQMGAAS